MPTQTFFNLPREKRETFLQAARAEFARVPYEDASINRMIHAAGIPRGSFYMYFSGKEDLFRYLMEEYGAWLADRMEDQLRRCGGDLFAAFLGFFDWVWTQACQPEQSAVILSRLGMIRLNGILRPELACAGHRPGQERDRLIALVDQRKLSLRKKDELADLFFLLSMLVGPALAQVLNGASVSAVRARLVSRMELLKRGAAAPKYAFPIR